MHKPTKRGQKKILTAEVAGEISRTGIKPAHDINRDIKRKRTTRKVWVSVKRDDNDG